MNFNKLKTLLKSKSLREEDQQIVINNPQTVIIQAPEKKDMPIVDPSIPVYDDENLDSNVTIEPGAPEISSSDAVDVSGVAGGVEPSTPPPSIPLPSSSEEQIQPPIDTPIIPPDMAGNMYNDEVEPPSIEAMPSDMNSEIPAPTQGNLPPTPQPMPIYPDVYNDEMPEPQVEPINQEVIPMDPSAGALPSIDNNIPQVPPSSTPEPLPAPPSFNNFDPSMVGVDPNTPVPDQLNPDPLIDLNSPYYNDDTPEYYNYLNDDPNQQAQMQQPSDDYMYDDEQEIQDPNMMGMPPMTDPSMSMQGAPDPNMGMGMDPNMMDPSMQPPMDPNMQGGMMPPNDGSMPPPAIDPNTGQPMDPNMMGGMPPGPPMGMGAPPMGGDPNMMGMDPSMGGAGMPPGAGGMPGMPPPGMPLNGPADPGGAPQPQSMLGPNDGILGNNSALSAGPPVQLEDLERINELKNIHNKILSIKKILNNEIDYKYEKIREKVVDAYDYYISIIKNLDSFTDQIDDIIIKYKRFLLVVLTEIEVLKKLEIANQK